MEKIRSSSAFQVVKTRSKPVRKLINKMVNDWSFELASMLAYNFLVAFVPIAISVLGFIGLILRDHPQTQEEMKTKIIDSFPKDNTTQVGIKQVVDLAFDQLSKDAGLIFATGILFAMFGSSRLFVAIDKCLTIIYRLPERSFLRQNLMAFGALFLFLIIIILVLVASSVPTALINTVSNDGGRFGVFLAGIIVSLFSAFCLFEMIYYLIPNKKMTLKKTWCGALVAAITLEIFIILFPLYVRQFMSNYAGQIGFAVIIILFFYYFSFILILGAQVNAHFFEKHPPFDQPLGTYLHQVSQEHRENHPEQSSTDNENKQQNTNGCLNVFCLFTRQKRSVQPQSEEDNRM